MASRSDEFEQALSGLIESTANIIYKEQGRPTITVGIPYKGEAADRLRTAHQRGVAEARRDERATICASILARIQTGKEAGENAFWLPAEIKREIDKVFMNTALTEGQQEEEGRQ